MRETAVIREKIYQALHKLPDPRLAEVWQFVKFVRFKDRQRSPKRVIKLGGLLSEYRLDFIEKDIAKAQLEMWHNPGEIHQRKNL